MVLGKISVPGCPANLDSNKASAYGSSMVTGHFGPKPSRPLDTSALSHLGPKPSRPHLEKNPGHLGP